MGSFPNLELFIYKNLSYVAMVAEQKTHKQQTFSLSLSAFGRSFRYAAPHYCSSFLCIGHSLPNTNRS